MLPETTWIVVLVVFSGIEQSIKLNCYWIICWLMKIIGHFLNQLLSQLQRKGVTTKKTLPWWYVFVTVGHVFCHACTSMTILGQNQDSHTCAVVEVFHDITKIIITEVFTSMMINHASQKCFRQGWPTRGIHCNGTPLSCRVRFWIR